MVRDRRRSSRFAEPRPTSDLRPTWFTNFADGARWLKITTKITNTSKQPLELNRVDAIRADGEFKSGADAALGLFWAYDPYWRQAYGAVFADPGLRLVPEETEGRGRPSLLLATKDKKPLSIAAGESRELVRYLFPAANTIDVLALANELRKKPVVDVTLTVRDPAGPVDGAEVTILSGDQTYGHGVTGADGRLTARLPAGDYKAVAAAQGRGETSLNLQVSKAANAEIELPAPGYVVAKLTDVAGKPIAGKVQFSGKDGTPNPNWGPDSAIHGVRNLYYTRERQVPRTARRRASTT